MSNPEQLFADFEAKLADAQRKANRMRTEIEGVSVSERSKDGQISVKVNHAGNLVGLEIGPSVRDDPALAQEILRVVQSAQSKLASAMRTGVPSIAGTETMNELVDQLQSEYPEPEPTGYVEGGHQAVDEDARFVAEDELDTPPPPPAPKSPAPPATPAPPRAARRQQTDHEDDYFTGGDFLR
ncbi:YbaB/EbfC family nucleoid-associated protein [Amycolatopsis sp. QT-25]|uniref:YbaB/EbfC family nucleoid-associated protein n=1 Tax=Amycolatopsis sp. QT-25 TaxID=3034022 RepID=UPI0023EC9C06|nr:YbaB/EbfC family nucleoid-associated protein [Amycolatopsis sp. QT-25]WET79648.1 YbaB/EbfC family nucleoid-associated protein [Amycolatopsis sp. QT-25]